MSASPVRIALVRCDKISENCPAADCFDSFNNRWGQFERYKNQDVIMVGSMTCGGCPGRRVSWLVKELVEKKDLQVLHFSTCIAGFDGKYNHQRCIHIRNMAGYARDMGVEVIGIE
jgi:predicted metal-binding protein